MSRIVNIVAGIGIGALSAYLLDPQQGRSRRALIRDKAGAALRVKLRAKEAILKDARNRLQGLVHGAQQKVRKPVAPADSTLVQRIRSEMGHVISHPKAIEVTSNHGRVRLSGSILAEELPKLITCVWDVPGVESIEHKSTVYNAADGVPELQGTGSTEEGLKESLIGQWKPGPALAMGTLGTALALYGYLRKDATGKLLTTAGLGLIAKSYGDAEGKALAAKITDYGW